MNAMPQGLFVSRHGCARSFGGEGLEDVGVCFFGVSNSGASKIKHNTQVTSGKKSPCGFG